MHPDPTTILPADPSRHFAAIAELLNTIETEPNTEASLSEWYYKQEPAGIQFNVAVSPRGDVQGFSGFYRSYTNRQGHYSMYLVVDENYRGCGFGSLLYEELLNQATQVGVEMLRGKVRDTSEDGLSFAEQRGFTLKKHSIEMQFDLTQWDESRFDPLIHALEEQGYCFTNMAELGDSSEARRKLFTLNNNAAATDPGSDGIPPWATFEEFEKDVCSNSWYHPESQIVAIDTHTGNWASMSAITIFQGADHAYNLFTGTDVHYRGRKLAQAVKSLALRWARASGVNLVRTSHNSENEAMIAIDTKLGYVRTPGMYSLVKTLQPLSIDELPPL